MPTPNNISRFQSLLKSSGLNSNQSVKTYDKRYNSGYMKTVRPGSKNPKDEVTDLGDILNTQNENIKTIAEDLAGYNNRNLEQGLKVAQPYRERDFHLQNEWDREKMDREDYWKQKQIAQEFSDRVDERNRDALAVDLQSQYRGSAAESNANLARTADSGTAGNGNDSLIGDSFQAISSILQNGNNNYLARKQSRAELLRSMMGGLGR